MSARLRGKVAVITGAGSGLGRASALRFASEGAAVLCADVDLTSAERVVGEIIAVGGRARSLGVDVALESDTERMAAVAASEFGRIDVLFANAGIAGVGSIASTSRETWDRVLAINLTGVWLCSKAVLPYMQSQGGGSVINQASIGGLVGFSGIMPYAAAKAGVIGMTRQAAVEYAAQNVRFNAICPGTVVTPLVTRTYEERGGIAMGSQQTLEEALQANAARYPLRRLGSVDDVAGMAVYLASDEALWITGAVFTVDGGYTAA
jgi:NAD(P)-dependent dehydrogenase (short-subunit alcohol dehydrogenase family)